MLSESENSTSLGLTAREKWGKALDRGGFQQVPNLLIRTQHYLGLSATDIVVLLNLNLHWWRPDEWPFPPPAVIASRMGVSKRTVERTLKNLESNGFIERLQPRKTNSGPQIRPISLKGLVEKLNGAAEWSIGASEFRRKQAGGLEKV